MQFLLRKVENNLTMVEKSHLQYQNLSFLNIQFRRLMMSWKWLGLSLFSKGNIEQIRKVSHTKIVSLTQWLEEDKSIFWLGHTVKRKSNILQTTYLKFNIPRKRFTSDLKLRFKNLKTYLNGKHLNIDENYGRF